MQGIELFESADCLLQFGPSEGLGRRGGQDLDRCLKAKFGYFLLDAGNRLLL